MNKYQEYLSLRRKFWWDTLGLVASAFLLLGAVFYLATDEYLHSINLLMFVLVFNQRGATS